MKKLTIDDRIERMMGRLLRNIPDPDRHPNKHQWRVEDIATLNVLRDQIGRIETLERKLQSEERRSEAFLATLSDVITVATGCGYVIRHIPGKGDEE